MVLPERLDDGSVLVDDYSIEVKVGVYDSNNEINEINIAACAASNKDIPIEYWLTATEYLVSVTAAISGMGYEKTMEHIMAGAVKYRHNKP